MSDLKRMIYIWEENLEFYSSLANKSEFVNLALAKARKEQEAKTLPGDPSQHPDPRIRETHAALKAMEDRDRANRA